MPTKKKKTSKDIRIQPGKKPPKVTELSTPIADVISDAEITVQYPPATQLSTPTADVISETEITIGIPTTLTLTVLQIS